MYGLTFFASLLLMFMYVVLEFDNEISYRFLRGCGLRGGYQLCLFRLYWPF